MNIISAMDKAVAYVCRLSVISGLVIVFGLLFVSIVARPFGIQVSGYDEIVELCIIWITMLGVVELWRTGRLYRVDLFDNLSHGKASVLSAVVQLLMLTFLAVLVYKGTEFAVKTNEATAFMRLPKLYYYSAIPVCGAVMSIYSLARLVKIVHAFFYYRKSEGVVEHYPGSQIRL